MGAIASSPADPSSASSLGSCHGAAAYEKTAAAFGQTPAFPAVGGAACGQRSGQHHRGGSGSSAAAAAASSTSSSSSSTSRLQTLKRRVAQLRRRPAPDPARQFRAFIANWSAADLRVLLDEFEALHALKDAYLGAAAARPRCDSLARDLGRLLHAGLGADARLLVAGSGAVFPVHRAVLAARSRYFARLFDAAAAATDDVDNGDFPLDLGGVPGGMDTELVRALLDYLYCGEVSLARLSAPATVAALCRELGAPGRLADDLADLLDSGRLADCALVFEGDSDAGRPRLELPCHRALLACRSPFFRGAIDKRLAALRRRRQQQARCAMHGRAASGGGFVGDAAASPLLALVLDEAVLPRRLAPAVLRCLYTDRLLLPPPASLQDLTELHELGRFLDLPCLTRACEDLLVESLGPDTLVPVLDWAGAGGGSAWVHRQARLFLREEFVPLSQLPHVLTRLSRREFMAALRCDFLQASEADVLAALIAWGEAELLRLADQSEPQLQQQPASNRKGGGGGSGISGRQKRAQAAAAAAAASAELSQVLGDLVAQGLRAEHLLCPDSLHEAARRRLLPPGTSLSRPAAWLHTGANGGGGGGSYRHPRLFTPHLEEIRSVLSDRVRDDHLTLQCPPEPPPRRLPAAAGNAGNATATAAGLWALGGQGGPDLVTTLPAGCCPIEAGVLAGLRRRVHELLTGGLFVRAALLPAADRAGLHRQAQLWAVRELGLPDSAVVLLPGRLPDVAFHGPS